MDCPTVGGCVFLLLSFTIVVVVVVKGCSNGGDWVGGVNVSAGGGVGGVGRDDGVVVVVVAVVAVGTSSVVDVLVL